MRDKPCLTSSDLQKAMAACRAAAEKNKWNVSIAIVDDGGYLLSFDRMDGAAADHRRGRDRQGAYLRTYKAAEQVLRGSRQGTPGVRQLPGRHPDPGRRADHGARRMRRRDRRLRRRLA